MIQLNQQKLILTSIGALSVIIGTILKNDNQNKLYSKFLEPLLFVGGWILLAYAASKQFIDLYAILPVVVVIIAALAIQHIKDESKAVKIIFNVLLVAGWLGFGYAIARGNRTKMMITGTSAIIMLSSVMYFLPQQRKDCIVDGPGMVMLVVAWTGMVFANALN